MLVDSYLTIIVFFATITAATQARKGMNICNNS